jgi:hypothetical protein
VTQPDRRESKRDSDRGALEDCEQGSGREEGLEGRDQGDDEQSSANVNARKPAQRRTLRGLSHFFNAQRFDLDDFLRPAGSIVVRWRTIMDWMDGLYVGLSVLFFGLTWAFVRLCERV